MTVFSLSRSIARDWHSRSHIIPITVERAVTAGAIALVFYLLGPTCGTESSNTPQRLPVSVGGTLFNVPTAAVRMKIQRHSGPQERIDLAFAFPSLAPPDSARHVSADTVEEALQPIDRIFLSIASHPDSLAPDMRVRTIYPRSPDPASAL